MGLNGLPQEREYKEALEAFNDKNKEKVQLITKLMEVRGNLILIIRSNHTPIACELVLIWSALSMQLVSESERMRLKKLEELSKNIETIRIA